jgi:predicted negative regulator of RcsB-dependent stress response
VCGDVLVKERHSKEALAKYDAAFKIRARVEGAQGRAERGGEKEAR